MGNKIFTVVYYLFVLLIIAVALMLFASLTSFGGLNMFVVESGSMEPTIKTGSTVLVKYQKEPYKISDIITFGPVTKTRKPTTHRVVDMRIQSGQAIYVTKGDANNDRDRRQVNHKDVIGKVILTIPYAGYAVVAAKNPMGFAALIIIPAFIVIFDESKKIYLELKKRRKNKQSVPNTEHDETN